MFQMLLNFKSNSYIKRAMAGLLAVSFLMSPLTDAALAAQAAKADREPAPKSMPAKKINEWIGKVDISGAQLSFVLGGFSRACNVNFTISPGAAGRIVSIFLNQPTHLDDLLNMIRESAGVIITEVDRGAYIVKTPEEAKVSTQGMTEKEKELHETERRLSNGLTRTFILRYAKASDVSTAITKVMGESAKNVCSVSVLGGDSESSSSSTSSTLGDDTREYATIVVYAANRDIMEHIENLVAAIDIPKPMVEVEAVFVEVSNNNNRDLGFDWSIMSDPIKFVESSVGTTIVDGTDAVPVFRKHSLGQFRRTTAANAEIGINLTEGEGRGRVLSNPRIRVISGHIAGFSSETQVPIMNKDSDGEIKTEYKNVGVNLDILPVVIGDDLIHLTVKPSVSAITDTVTLGDTQAPQIAERKAETTLVMRDGETMVIGGLLSDRDIKSFSRVPILWKIPLFGELFQSENKTKEHSSISVYLRLKLIKDYMNEPVKSDVKREQIEMLLSGIDAKDIENRRKSGGFGEKVTIEGILPVAMEEAEPERVEAEITPVSRGNNAAVTEGNKDGAAEIAAANKDWESRYEEMTRKYKESGSAGGVKKQAEVKVERPAAPKVKETQSSVKPDAAKQQADDMPVKTEAKKDDWQARYEQLAAKYKDTEKGGQPEAPVVKAQEPEKKPESEQKRPEPEKPQPSEAESKKPQAPASEDDISDYLY